MYRYMYIIDIRMYIYIYINIYTHTTAAIKADNGTSIANTDRGRAAGFSKGIAVGNYRNQSPRNSRGMIWMGR